MKLAAFFVSLVALSLALPWARADLTLVQSVEGSSGRNEMTMKLKGDKMRIDVSPQVTTIIDAKTGEMINLMNDQKKVMRISGEKVRATMEMAQQQFKAKNGKKETKAKPTFVATGKKETINGYETEQYTW
jgi:Zn-dependent M32 family carboxypeptidase